MENKNIQQNNETEDAESKTVEVKISVNEKATVVVSSGDEDTEQVIVTGGKKKATTENETPHPKKNFFEKAANFPILRHILNSRNVGILILKILLMIAVIPYAYIWLCALLFEVVLGWMHSSAFVFYSDCALLVIGILLSVWAVIRMANKSSKGR